MAIGESIFDIFYLLFILYMYKSIKNKYNEKIITYIKYAVLLLLIGDSCHLIPRILNYFIDYDFSMFIGLGKFMTSITMTLFYYLLYKTYDKRNDLLVNILLLSRIVLCLLPGNGWLANNGTYIMGIIRNIPFVILGIIVIIKFYGDRGEDFLKYVWLYMIFSFLFYLPVVLGASFIPMLGMFMIPKTICYMKIVSKLYDYCDYINGWIKE